MPNIRINITAEQQAALEAYRQDVREFPSGAIRFDTVADLCAGLFSELILGPALEAHPPAAVTAAVNAEKTARANREKAQRPKLGVTIV